MCKLCLACSFQISLTNESNIISKIIRIEVPGHDIKNLKNFIKIQFSVKEVNTVHTLFSQYSKNRLDYCFCIIILILHFVFVFKQNLTISCQFYDDKGKIYFVVELEDQHMVLYFKYQIQRYPRFLRLMSPTIVDYTWKKDGCSTNQSNDSFVECWCDHMTPFAVLLVSIQLSILSQGSSQK